jgi:hypothetical protein
MSYSPTYAAACIQGSNSPIPAARAEPAEEGAELLCQEQQTSAPWNCHFFMVKYVYFFISTFIQNIHFFTIFFHYPSNNKRNAYGEKDRFQNWIMN